MKRLFSLCVILLASTGVIAADQAAGDAEIGRQFWTAKHTIKGEMRSCASCHTANPRNAGKHVRTTKSIKPLSPAVNPASLSDEKKIEKWFRRNCKWTLGRECSIQEKANVLVFLKSN